MSRISLIPNPSEYVVDAISINRAANDLGLSPKKIAELANQGVFGHVFHLGSDNQSSKKQRRGFYLNRPKVKQWAKENLLKLSKEAKGQAGAESQECCDYKDISERMDKLETDIKLLLDALVPGLRKNIQ